MEEIEAYLNTGYVKPSGKGKLPIAPDYGVCSEAHYKRFTRSANHIDVAGLDSRHGHDPKKIAPDNPMSLTEGTVFIKQLLEKTLDQQASRLAQASKPSAVQAD